MADALADAGQTKAAVREYVRIVQRAEATPGSTDTTCAIDGIGKLKSTDPPAQCVVAAALRDAGADDDARKILIKQIEAGKACKDLQPSDLGSRGERILGSLKDILPVALLLLGLAILILLIARMSNPRFAKWLRRTTRAQLIIGPFGDPSDGPKSSGSLLARTRQDFFKLARTDPSADSFDIVDAYQDLAPVLGDIEKVHSSLAPAAALVRIGEKVISPARWTLTGQINAPQDEHISVTAAFASGGRQLDVMTFDAPIKDPAKPTEGEVLGIADSIAGWAQLVAAGDLLDDLSPTPTPAAYGWLRAGVGAQERGDMALAARSYALALTEDPGYLRARIALGIVRADVADSRTAVEILEEVAALVGEP